MVWIMERGVFGLQVVAAVAAVVMAGAGSALADGPLQGEVEARIRAAGLGTTQMGVIVIDAATGRTLAERNADEMLIPASNQKLLTSGTALQTLGADFSFETSLLVDRAAGNRLIVRGSGDPAFGDALLLEDMGLTVDQLLDMWVNGWTSAVGGAPGEIVIDDRVFDRELVHPSWPAEQLNRWYCAEVSGLTFYTNCVALFMTPSGAGQAPVIQAEPRARWMNVINQGRSVRSGQQTVWAAREAGTNNITVHGDVRYVGEPVLVTVHDPAMAFGKILAERIAAAAGKGTALPTVRLAREEEVLDGEAVHVVRTPIATVLERCNTDSHNLYAECLLKRTAHEITGAGGSWQTGAAVIRSMLSDRVGELAADVKVADGSGMSRDNKVSARAMGAWLRSMLGDKESAEVYIDSLAEPGSGTLAKWFAAGTPQNEVSAKSGYLRGVTALSGYVRDPQSGRTAIVVTIANEWPGNVALSKVRAAQEAVFLEADEWVSAGALSEVIPGGG